jgi:ribosomal protein S18 acetylase RimI-like enzyme
MLIRDHDPARDLEPCLAIWRRASEVGHPFIDAADLDADAALVRERYMPAATIRVAEAEGRPAGFIALLGSFIGGLFVDPAAHGRGIGRSLVRDALADHPCLDVEVYEANAGARAFYARLGFRETGRREADDQGRPWPLLRLRLDTRQGDRAAQGTGHDR